MEVLWNTSARVWWSFLREPARYGNCVSCLSQSNWSPGPGLSHSAWHPSETLGSWMEGSAISKTKTNRQHDSVEYRSQIIHTQKSPAYFTHRNGCGTKNLAHIVREGHDTLQQLGVKSEIRFQKYKIDQITGLAQTDLLRKMMQKHTIMIKNTLNVGHK